MNNHDIATHNTLGTVVAGDRYPTNMLMRWVTTTDGRTHLVEIIDLKPAHCQTHALTVNHSGLVSATQVDPFGRPQCDRCYHVGETLRLGIQHGAADRLHDELMGDLPGC